MSMGCLLVPDLALQALRRARPDWADRALAVAEGEGARARIHAASESARRLGVRQGQALGEARAFAPELLVQWVEPRLVEDAESSVFDAAYRVSPRVELARVGRDAVAWIDGQGLERLFADPRTLASALVASAHRVGFQTRAALAPGKRLALLAAQRGEGIEVIGEGQGRSFVAGLPLAALSGDRDLLESLGRWGLRSGSDFAALPPDGVGARLGRAGVLLHRLCCGEDVEPLHPSIPLAVHEERCHLDYVLVALEGLLFLLRPALERLVERLDCRGMACGKLSLHLELDPVGEAVVPVGLAAPTREVGAMLSLCRAAIEAHPPGAGVRGMRLVAEPAEVRSQQLGLWDLPLAAPMKIMAAVAQVAAIAGSDRVGRAELPDSHLPEAWSPAPFEPADPPPRLPGEPAPAIPAAVTTLRCFRPPIAVEVRMDARGPHAVSGTGVRGLVVNCAGPFRVEVGWHEQPIRRDAWDLELSDGAVYRVSQNREDGQWWALGRYD